MKLFLPHISRCPKWCWLILLLSYLYACWQGYQISHLLHDGGLSHFAVVFLYPSAVNALTGLYLTLLKRMTARRRVI